MAETRRSKSTKASLPPELILEIFVRLPTKSLKRLICVFDDHPIMSKELKTPSFRRRHAINVMNQHANQQLMIPSEHGSDVVHVFEGSNELVTDPITNQSRRYEFEQLFKDFLPHGTETFESCEVIGSCNGLVCLFFAFYTLPRWEDVRGGGCRCCAQRAQSIYSYHLVLWNPCTGEHHVLPLPRKFKLNSGIGDDGYIHPTVWGFGYDVVNETYKVVMGEGRVTQFYDLSTDGWKKSKKVKVDNWDDFDYLKYEPDSNDGFEFGHYLNGSLHWIVSNTTVVSIDLSSRVGSRIRLPHCCSSEPYNHHLNMGVLKGCLSVACFCRDEAKEVRIWVMETYGQEESWTYTFTVRLIDSFHESHLRPPLWMSQDEEMMLFLLQDQLGCWNTEAQEFTFVENPKFSQVTRGIVHFDTLVSPKPENYRHNNETRTTTTTTAT